MSERDAALIRTYLDWVRSLWKLPQDAPDAFTRSDAYRHFRIMEEPEESLSQAAYGLPQR